MTAVLSFVGLSCGFPSQVRFEREAAVSDGGFDASELEREGGAVDGGSDALDALDAFDAFERDVSRDGGDELVARDEGRAEVSTEASVDGACVTAPGASSCGLCRASDRAACGAMALACAGGQHCDRCVCREAPALSSSASALLAVRHRRGDGDLHRTIVTSMAVSALSEAIYVAGVFFDRLELGAATAGTTAVLNEWHPFVAKVRARDLSVEWLRPLGDYGADQRFSLQVIEGVDGNVYLAGTMGPFGDNAIDLAGPAGGAWSIGGRSHVIGWLASLTAANAPLWVRALENLPLPELGGDVVVTSLAQRTNGTLVVGGSVQANERGASSAYVAEYASVDGRSGPVVLLRDVTTGSTAVNVVVGLARGPENSVYVMGTYMSALRLGESTVIEAPLLRDCFVTRVGPLSMSMSLPWVLELRGLSSGGVQGAVDLLALRSDAEGNAYFTGSYNAALEPRVAAVPGRRLPSVTDDVTTPDIVLGSVSASGSLRFLRSIGAEGVDTAYGLAADADGNVFVSGAVCGGATNPDVFGLGATRVQSCPDGFVASYDRLGVPRWARLVNANASSAMHEELVTQVARLSEGSVVFYGMLTRGEGSSVSVDGVSAAPLPLPAGDAGVQGYLGLLGYGL